MVEMTWHELVASAGYIIALALIAEVEVAKAKKVNVSCNFLNPKNLILVPSPRKDEVCYVNILFWALERPSERKFNHVFSLLDGSCLLGIPFHYQSPPCKANAFLSLAGSAPSIIKVLHARLTREVRVKNY